MTETQKPRDIATPEGDNEAAPGSVEDTGSEPLPPVPINLPSGLETPPGSAPSSYERDHK